MALSSCLLMKFGMIFVCFGFFVCFSRLRKRVKYYRFQSILLDTILLSMSHAQGNIILQFWKKEHRYSFVFLLFYLSKTLSLAPSLVFQSGNHKVIKCLVCPGKVQVSASVSITVQKCGHCSERELKLTQSLGRKSRREGERGKQSSKPCCYSSEETITFQTITRLPQSLPTIKGKYSQSQPNGKEFLM